MKISNGLSLLLFSFLPIIKSQEIESKRPLTAEDVIQAPRPTSATASPDGELAFISTSTYNFNSKSTKSDLYLLDLLSPSSLSSSSPSPIISNLSNPVWFSRDELAYLDGDHQTLYLKNVSKSQIQDPNDRGFRVGGFPTKIDNLKVIGASDREKDEKVDEIYLLFTAEVYDDGKLESVKELDNSERELSWEKVKGENKIKVWGGKDGELEVGGRTRRTFSYLAGFSFWNRDLYRNCFSRWSSRQR